jgi:hypothetical protein
MLPRTFLLSLPLGCTPCGGSQSPPVAPAPVPEVVPAPAAAAQPVSLVTTVHPLDLPGGPPLEIALAHHCRGPLGPGATVERTVGLDGLTGPACLFESLAPPRECPECPECEPPEGEAEPEPEPEPEVTFEFLPAPEPTANLTLRTKLPEGPRARIRVRGPGPVLIYAQGASDEMFCVPLTGPSRAALVTSSLVLEGPSEIWVDVSRGTGYDHRVVGVLTGASPDEVRRLLGEPLPGPQFDLAELPEGVQHAWLTDDLSWCCCPICC